MKRKKKTLAELLNSLWPADVRDDPEGRYLVVHRQRQEPWRALPVNDSLPPEVFDPKLSDMPRIIAGLSSTDFKTRTLRKGKTVRCTQMFPVTYIDRRTGKQHSRNMQFERTDGTRSPVVCVFDTETDEMETLEPGVAARLELRAQRRYTFKKKGR